MERNPNTKATVIEAHYKRIDADNHNNNEMEKNVNWLHAYEFIVSNIIGSKDIDPFSTGSRGKKCM